MCGEYTEISNCVPLILFKRFYHILWGRTSWVCHKSFIEPSDQISRAQKGHRAVFTMSFIFLQF